MLYKYWQIDIIRVALRILGLILMESASEQKMRKKLIHRFFLSSLFTLPYDAVIDPKM